MKGFKVNSIIISMTKHTRNYEWRIPKIDTVEKYILLAAFRAVHKELL
jgi:hypothetical protein